MVNNTPAMQEGLGLIPDLEDSLEKAVTTCSSILVQNPMDRGPWQTAVHAVSKESDTTERRTQLLL